MHSSTKLSPPKLDKRSGGNCDHGRALTTAGRCLPGPPPRGTSRVNPGPLGWPAAQPPIGCRPCHLSAVSQEGQAGTQAGLRGRARARAVVAGSGLWAPLLLCLLQAAPENLAWGSPRVFRWKVRMQNATVMRRRSQLAPPQNVTLFSQNFSVYLTWLPGPGNPQNVTYVVAYQSLPNPRRWRRVKSCVGTTELACPLMCLEKQDLYNKFKGRVKAAAPGARSPWVESEYLEYLFEVEPAPPNLEVTRAEEVLSVSASYQLPSCAPPLDLSFQVEFWKEGTRNKTLLPVTDFGEPVQISLPPTASGHHCLRARAVYTLPEPRHSQFSVPTCFFLEAPGTSWAFLVLPSLLLLLCISATGGAIWKSLTGNPWFQRAQMPQALDFSGHRPLGATFQPSGLDLPDDIVIHPQKEPTRRVGLTTVRALSALQAGSGDSAQDPEEDEDADDSSSFQPYIEPPAFPGPVHLVSGYSKACGAASGECWPPVVQAEDSARASSARSWACTGDASYPWVQAGASGYLAKEGPGQGLRADRSRQSLSPPKLLEDLDFMEELPKHDLPWATSGFSWPGLDLGPGEPPVSLQTLTFHWDSGSEEGEDEDEGGRESETGDSDESSGGAERAQMTQVGDRMLRQYMAR